MKKLILLNIALVIIASVSPLNSQKLIKGSFIAGKTYAGTKVNRIYIPPPKEFWQKAGAKGRASISVYYTSFPQSAITAVEYATSVLEAILPADANITILATWEPITTKGVLAQSSVNRLCCRLGYRCLQATGILPFGTCGTYCRKEAEWRS